MMRTTILTTTLRVVLFLVEEMMLRMMLTTMLPTMLIAMLSPAGRGPSLGFRAQSSLAVHLDAVGAATSTPPRGCDPAPITELAEASPRSLGRHAQHFGDAPGGGADGVIPPVALEQKVAEDAEIGPVEDSPANVRSYLLRETFEVLHRAFFASDSCSSARPPLTPLYVSAPP